MTVHLSARLLIPRPWDPELFRASLERQRNRLLFLTAVALASAPASLWIATADADYIFYEQDAARGRQQYLIGHQVAHMLFGHQGIPVRRDVARTLFPGLDPGMVAAAIKLSAYTSAEEQVADVFGALLLARIRSRHDS